MLSLALRRRRSSRTWGALLFSDRCHFRFSFRGVSVLDPTWFEGVSVLSLVLMGYSRHIVFADFMIYAPSPYESISGCDADLPKLRPAQSDILGVFKQREHDPGKSILDLKII